jgi:fructose-bisphosphate aldolase class I
VILFDETIRQSTAAGVPFVEVLAAKGVVPGIKVDTGGKDLAFSPGEKVTEGLDGLRERLAEYRRLGARFAKWRGILSIGPGRPSDRCVHANAHALARYAALCVEQGLTPIVEPEVLMDGAHDLEACLAATEKTLRRTFAELAEAGVPPAAMLLKPNMVLPGAESPKPATDEQIARATIRCFRATVPEGVPGIVFLSGGQTEAQATARLHAMHALGERLPWRLSFSYGRALQASALKAWKGEAKNVPAAQAAFLTRARLNGAAVRGAYAPSMEPAAAS